MKHNKLSGKDTERPWGVCLWGRGVSEGYSGEDGGGEVGRAWILWTLWATLRTFCSSQVRREAWEASYPPTA